MSTRESRERDAHEDLCVQAWLDATDPDPATGHPAQYELDQYGTWAMYCRCDGADRTNPWGDSMSEVDAREAVLDHKLETATGRL